MHLFTPSVCFGLLGGITYVLWDFSEWYKLIPAERVPLLTFLVKSMVYVVVAFAICSGYDGTERSLPVLAAFQIGASSPLIWREILQKGTSAKLQKMRSTSDPID
ncbi:MAG: hypothetical protein WC647_16175 [Desulfomonilaceae bacterium]|jgi:hypothetical protein